MSPAPASAPRHDPLAEDGRVDWGTAVLVCIELAILVPLGLLLFTTDLRLWPIVPPLLVFLAIRLPGDFARAVAGTQPGGLMIEGPSKALAWAVVPHGVWSAMSGGLAGAPGWLFGLALTLFGLALWGHHARAVPYALLFARFEGTLGALVAPFGLAVAATVFTPGAPWSVLVPAMVLAVAGALAARAVFRLWRTERRDLERSGWLGWYQTHFFRLSLLLAAVVIYLFVRDTIAGLVPFLFLFEYSFAVFVAAGILWSLRGYARKQVTDEAPVGPHKRHEQAVERQGEGAFDEAEGALGRFLESGDPDAVRPLAAALEQRGVPAGQALAPVLTHRPERGVLLVHPGWLYASRVLVVFLVVWGLASAMPDDADPFLGLIAAAGIYSVQWNRHGGPWPIKPAFGSLGLLWAVGVFAAYGDTMLLTQMPFPLIITVLVALLFVHPLRARKGRPVPRFLYQGQDPLEAIDPLIQRHDRSVMVRGMWAGGVGIIVFIIVGELSRLSPAFEVLFTLYVMMAIAALVQPLFITAGLRSGRQQAKRRHERARKQREALLTESLRRLEAVLVRPSERRRRVP